MEFMLCIATEERHAHNVGGYNDTSDGVDWIASLFFVHSLKQDGMWQSDTSRTTWDQLHCTIL